MDSLFLKDENRDQGNAYWESVNNCLVCDSPSDYHASFQSLADEGVRLYYCLCKICGLVFQSPRLSEKGLEAYYSKVYHKQKMPSREDIRGNIWVQRKRGSYITELTAKLQLEPKAHLDIGASRGAVMKAFHNSFKCETFGIEPGEELRRMLNSQGLQSFADIDHLPTSLRNKFDVITMSHTLEHVPEPRNFLAKLQDSWLATSGLIIVEVPNLYWHPALEFSHLTAFTEGSLDSLAGQSGHRVSHLIKHGRPYSRRLPLFLLSVLEPAKEQASELGPVDPLYWIRIKRWLGTNIYRLFQRVASIIYHQEKMSPWRK